MYNAEINMYNAEIKEKFLYDTAGTNRANRQIYIAVFRQFEKLESAHGIDVGQMPRELIAKQISAEQNTNYHTAYNHAMVINKYRTWYAAETGFVDPSWRPIDIQEDVDFVSACKANLYSSFDEILADLKKVDYDFHCGDEVAPAICLSWLGFKVTDIIELKTDRVNLKKGYITDENGAIIVKSIPEDILKILSDYKNTTESYRVLNGKQAVRQLDTGYFIHKMIRGDSKRSGKVVSGQLLFRMNILRKTFETRFGEGSCKMAVLENVWTSGCFYRLYQLERNGLDIYDKANFPMLQNVLQGAKNRMYGARYVYTQYKKAFNLK